MARRHLILAAAMIASALPVQAGVQVIGSSNARMCYLATETPAGPVSRDIDICNQAIAEERDDLRRLVSTHVNRGVLRLRAGNVVGALADFDEATRLDPSEPEAYLNRANILLRQREAQGAIAQFDAALTRNTRRPDLAHYGRGVAHEDAGDLRAAYRDYQRASALAPGWGEPRAELARFRVVRN